MPGGDPASSPDVAKAKQMVQQSGMAGQPVTVWAQNRQPRLEWAENYAATLNAIGFKATLKTIADADYFSTIETLKNHPQTGFADWQQDFPNPTDFYQNRSTRTRSFPWGTPTTRRSTTRTSSRSWQSLYPVPATQLASVASRWAALDYYVAQKAYVVSVRLPVLAGVPVRPDRLQQAGVQPAERQRLQLAAAEVTHCADSPGHDAPGCRRIPRQIAYA